MPQWCRQEGGGLAMLVQVVMAVLEASRMPVESCQLVPGEVCRKLKTESVI